MKCESCKEDVSPKYVAAIRDNKCPACGGGLLDDVDHKRIFKVKAQLVGLGIDDNTLFSVAAALSEKFTLVPRDLLLSDKPEAAPVEKKKAPPSMPKKTKASSTVVTEAYDEEDLDEDEDSEAIQKEWGMKTNKITVDKTVDYTDMLDPGILDDFSKLNAPSHDADDGDTDRAILLAKAAATKARNSDKMIRRL
jgi:hypothetical protein